MAFALAHLGLLTYIDTSYILTYLHVCFDTIHSVTDRRGQTDKHILTDIAMSSALHSDAR